MAMLPVGVSGHEGGADIFAAVQRGDVQQCAKIVHEDRSALAQRGWGGFSPLHYAALQGNRPLVNLLVSHGADCNALCQAGQTPFHFASRVAVQYLSETKMFSFSDTDNFLISPLHLAASTGNLDMVKYLLRNNRCAADASDQQGATALHVAAERGAVEVSWLLMREAGLQALHLRNHNGFTPLDLCRQGATFRHQQLAQILMKFISMPADHRPEESHGMYYWALLFPSLSGGAIFLMAVLLGGYGGILCVLLFPWLAKCIFTQYHRMSSYQRQVTLSPKPYCPTLFTWVLWQLGYCTRWCAFMSRSCRISFILSSLSDFRVDIKLRMLRFLNEDLHIQPSNSLLHVSIIHFSLVLWLFWHLLIKNPGHMQGADADPRFSSIADLVEANESLSRFCIECEMFQPDGCKHCRLCSACVLEYDHHCLFIGRCVGRDNRRLFLLFLLAMVIAHTLFLLAAVQYLLHQMGGAPQAPWGTEAWVQTLAVMNLVTALWEIWLLREQVQALALGTTTYFKHSPYPHHPPRQRWAAVVNFLIEGRLNWERVQTSSVDV
ncbi:putative ZDHHC-type palmitoyltransferase 6 [Scleropages formosus]|uniref:Palmitoyltransferase n=1 Tax=Scleropages formosus TaxID=113540 RepID=A0A0P7USA1_SCLFO|nr:putative ZDHHC-type palmitoyltransferase 6 [Scleropages formosus]